MKSFRMNVYVIFTITILNSCFLLLNSTGCSSTYSITDRCAYFDSSSNCIRCKWQYVLTGKDCIDRIPNCNSYDSRGICTTCATNTQFYSNRCINNTQFEFTINEKVCFSTLKCSWRSNLKLKSTYNWTVPAPVQQYEKWLQTYKQRGVQYTQDKYILIDQQPNGKISGFAISMNSSLTIDGSFSSDGLSIDFVIYYDFGPIYYHTTFDPKTEIISGYYWQYDPSIISGTAVWTKYAN